MNRDKVRGLIIGGAVGDAWGMPVESWTPKRILETHPNGVNGYKDPIGHKWFTDDPECKDENKTYMKSGFTTDDTQLTKATVKGLIKGNGFDMDSIAEAHVKAMQSSIAGWGKSTVEAIRRLSNNVHWSQSGKTTNAQRGTGNGIPMKCAPLAAFRNTMKGSFLRDEYYHRLIDFSAMTHYTQMSLQACVIHCESVLYCLNNEPENFDINDWMNVVCKSTWNDIIYQKIFCDYIHLNSNDDNLEIQFTKLWNAFKSGELEHWDQDKIVKEFGGGSCYVFHSLPFSYAFFCKSWKKGLGLGYEIIHAGGDTDTNAKIALEMLGALHGMELFERPENKWTIDGLHEYSELIDMADEFCDTFGIA